MIVNPQMKSVGSKQLQLTRCHWYKTKIILFVLFCSQIVFANEPLLDSASTAYAKNKFETAAKYYETILTKGLESTELYYNLGNAYYKSNKLGLAILNYERAKRISSADEDVNFNLKLANQKLIDKVEMVPQFFIKDWYINLLHLYTEKGWSIMCIFLLTFALVLFAFYVFSKNMSIRKFGFWSGLFFVLLSSISYLIALKNYNELQKHNEAIVIVQTLNVKDSPSNEGKDQFILHEGTKAIINQTRNEWLEIKIVNGNVGWVKANCLAII